jgi:hypothetical protein
MAAPRISAGATGRRSPDGPACSIWRPTPSRRGGSGASKANREVDMTRRRGKDSGRIVRGKGTPSRAGEKQAGKRARDDRPEREKQRHEDPDAIQRSDQKSH